MWFGRDFALHSLIDTQQERLFKKTCLSHQGSRQQLAQPINYSGSCATEFRHGRTELGGWAETISPLLLLQLPVVVLLNNQRTFPLTLTYKTDLQLGPLLKQGGQVYMGYLIWWFIWLTSSLFFCCDSHSLLYLSPSSLSLSLWMLLVDRDYTTKEHIISAHGLDLEILMLMN